jgi:hypothetical protein
MIELKICGNKAVINVGEFYSVNVDLPTRYGVCNEVKQFALQIGQHVKIDEKKLFQDNLIHLTEASDYTLQLSKHLSDSLYFCQK